MAHLPQNCTFRCPGFEDGVDMPLNCALLEFGENAGLGYSSASYFERVFRQRFKLSPLKHRGALSPRGANRRAYAEMRPHPLDSPGMRLRWRIPHE